MSAEGGARSPERGNRKKVLVCFAVKEEANPFQRAMGPSTQVRVLITGMGERNTRFAFEQALAEEKPGLVLTCGFAGGLRPELKTGTVLCQCKQDPELATRLEKAGARPGKFAFSNSVATTAAEKRTLWDKSKADAVEMESQVIQMICQEKNIPCATVRVILDSAEEDLPLNFNELMTQDQTLNYAKLGLILLRSPGKIRALLKLQKQSRAAAEKLSMVLLRFHPIG